MKKYLNIINDRRNFVSNEIKGATFIGISRSIILTPTWNYVDISANRAKFIRCGLLGSCEIIISPISNIIESSYKQQSRLFLIAVALTWSTITLSYEWMLSLVSFIINISTVGYVPSYEAYLLLVEPGEAFFLFIYLMLFGAFLDFIIRWLFIRPKYEIRIQGGGRFRVISQHSFSALGSMITSLDRHRSGKFAEVTYSKNRYLSYIYRSS